jgi:hypothetical protein
MIIEVFRFIGLDGEPENQRADASSARSSSNGPREPFGATESGLDCLSQF